MRWTSDELAFLEDLAGTMGAAALIQQFQRRWPHRSEGAIRLQAFKRRISLRLINGSALSLSDAARLLGCSANRLRRWLQYPEVRKLLGVPYKCPGKSYEIKRKAWRRLAQQKPEIFGGFLAPDLYALLEDATLAETVARQVPTNGNDYRIRCRETGQTWPSAVAAAAELNVCPSTIARALRRRAAVPSLGLRFERLRAAYLESQPAAS